MAEREFDPGLDTPRYNEPGAGQPVPGSPVDEDAKMRQRVNEEQNRINVESAQNPEDPSARMNETESVQSAAGEKSTTTTTRSSSKKAKGDS